MDQIETDYLVVGAGASGMAFIDTMLEQSDADIVVVERRHRPAGHWNDAYPFVRLHQPAAFYGVGSRPLEAPHMDVDADRAGLATCTEICEYYLRVLEDHFLPSGRVRFLGMTDYRGGADGTHELCSLVSGASTTVRVRRKLVDARYPEMSIPSRHTPSFTIDPGVRLTTPNGLVELDRPASGYTVLGAGKTSMDTCVWLLEQGVPADRIRWVRPRDAWAVDRQFFRPDGRGIAFLTVQVMLVEAAAAATSGRDLAARLEAAGMLHRLDPTVEPDIFRGATLSRAEAATLRQVEDVIRMGKVVHIGLDTIGLTGGGIPTDADQVHVDCTASGAAPPDRGPIFQPGMIDTNLTTFGIFPWSAATIAYVEATRGADEEKNRLCPVVPVPGEVDRMPATFAALLAAGAARSAEPDLALWEDGLRLNPGNGLAAHLDDPEAQTAMATIMANMEPAMDNLEKLAAGAGLVV